MIDPKVIREKTEIVTQGLKNRGATFDIENLPADRRQTKSSHTGH